MHADAKSLRVRAKSDDDDGKGSRNGATSRVFRATSEVIDAMRESIGGMSERFAETSENQRRNDQACGCKRAVRSFYCDLRWRNERASCFN
jgi:hypothetical protein